MKILFLSTWYPYPPDNGSKLRILGLLRGLCPHHEVTLLAFSDQSEEDLDSQELSSLCRDVVVIPKIPLIPRVTKPQLGFLNSKPRFVSDTFSLEMVNCIQKILAAEKFDLVIASQFGTAIYRSYFGRVPTIFEEVEVGLFHTRFTHSSSLWQRVRNGLTWGKYRHYLARLINDFQLCTVVSEQEKRLLSKVVPKYGTIEVIPNFIILADYNDVKVTPQSDSLIFTGPFRYLANHDAMKWFLEKVYPLIQAQVPDVHLTITGDNANLPLPPATNVTLTGFIEDIRPLVASSSVSLAPIREGGGTRLKILEAMALGVPVVSTSKGEEGLELIDGQHLLIGDTPEAFANSVVRLLGDMELRQGIAHRAQKLVKEKYDTKVVAPRFEKLVHNIGEVRSANMAI